MYCLFNFKYRMTTYYSYKVTNNGEQEIGVEYMKLWENYDDMCDELDKWVGGLTGKDVKPDRSKIACLYPCASMVYHKEDGCEAHITRMQVVPKKPDTVDCDAQDKHLETHFDEIFKRSQKVKSVNGKPEENMWYDPVKQWAYYAYFPEGETFYDPESNTENRTIEFEKKYVYQYFVENDYKGITSLSLKASQKYASFDEACDAMDKELSELYEIDGKEPLQRNRLVIKTLLGKSSRITYASYNDGGSTTDKYVLVRQEV